MENEEDRSLEVTPSYTVAAVLTVMVAISFSFNSSLEWCKKWLEKTWKGSLYAALEKITEELMVFAVLSLLMAHFRGHITDICIKSSPEVSRFYPCTTTQEYGKAVFQHTYYFNRLSVVSHEEESSNVTSEKPNHSICPEGKELFVSDEALEQLHRLMFVLVIVHVYYSFISVALAMSKIYSWNVWERHAKLMAIEGALVPGYGSSLGPWQSAIRPKVTRITSFVSHQTSHPWSQDRVLVWLLCFSRQFWSSINQADYMALRHGFITAHELPVSYDFHNYMLRSTKEEFRDICGISLPLWIYAIMCIILDFHGSRIYFWLSFLPILLILLLGTKLHRVVVKIATEIEDDPMHQFRLRDDLFWFGKPRILLWLIQLISFQDAFEMATFLWSLWEINDASCFMEDTVFLVFRLVFGLLSQCWCSYTTFPLYVIVTQMGSKFKKSVVTSNVRTSLRSWSKRAKARQNSSTALLGRSASSSVLSRSASSISSWTNDRSTSINSAREYPFTRLTRNSSSASTYSYKSSRVRMEEEISFAPSSRLGGSTSEDYQHHRESSSVKDDLCLLPRRH